MVKEFTQNGWNDMTEAEGGNLQRHHIYGDQFTAVTQFNGALIGDVTGNLDGVIGAGTPDTASFTSITGSLTCAFSGGFIGNLVGNSVGLHDGGVGTNVPDVGLFTLLTADDISGPLTGNVTGNVSGNVTGDVTGNVTGDVTGSLVGNADTATSLSTDTTFTISGDASGTPQTFNGSSNIDIPVTVTGGSVDTADAWTTPRSLTLAGDVTGSASIDGSGNVTLTTALQATATQGTSVDSAARWTTSRTLSATGDVTGSVSGVDGSGNISLPLTYSANINAIDGLSPDNNNFIVGNGSTWVAETGATVRNSLGLGSAATQASSAFATAAQGTLAASALQSVPSTYDTRAVANTLYASAAQGTLAGTAVQPNTALNTGTGSLTINGVVFSVSSSAITVSSGGVNLFSVNRTSGDVVFRGNVTANGTP